MTFRIGLALGGGAARGMAHIGVLRELERARIPLHCVAGTSIGSLVGCVYARRGMVEDVEMRVENFLASDTFKNAQIQALANKDDETGGLLDTLSGVMRKALLYTHGMTTRSMISVEEYEKSLWALVEDIEIEQLKLPFAAVAADITAAREVVFTSGSLRRAVQASCAIPGVFPPVEENGRIMVDGGWVDVVPVEPCVKLGADFVIAVDISQDLVEDVDLRRSINILLRTNAVTRVKLRECQIRNADFVIKPPVGAFHWGDFSRAKEGIEIGAKATREIVENLKAAIKKKRRWNFFG